ncbi:hypothetical protein MMC12_005414 [Toensbergia leucococca]|nr:hypothetical protein [Toensbergia leucococca]
MPVGNTPHEFLERKIIGKKYEWTESRRYTFQEYDRQDHPDNEDGRTGNPERVGLPYKNEDSILDDRQRQPETKLSDILLETAVDVNFFPTDADSDAEDELATTIAHGIGTKARR